MLRSLSNIIFLILFLFASSAYGQNFVDREGPDAKFAKFCMQFGNYYDAQKEYTLLLKESPKNVTYKYNLGKCHLYLNVDKSQAIPYFLWVSKQSSAKTDVWYDLGQAYLETNQIDKAKESFLKYIQVGGEDKHFISAIRRLEMCANAEKAMANPRDIELENVGKTVNSPYPEYNPFATANEKMLVFSSQRKMNLGSYRYEDGYYASDMWISFYRYQKWKKSKRFPSIINSKNIEVGGSMSPDGSRLFVYQMELITRTEKLMLSEKKGRYFRRPKPIAEGLHGVKSATFSPDKKRLYLAMEKSDGLGGIDIYFQTKDMYGHWTDPELDSVLSTPYNDHFPSFGPDGTFYYCSEGHNSMGGYDLFSAQYNTITGMFSKVENLGYPVNTTRDDKTISFSTSNRYAYISSLRENGYGDLDIYRVIFKDVKPVYTILRGKILNQDSLPFTTEIAKMNAHIDTLNIPINHEYKDLLIKKKDTVKAMDVLATKIPYEKVEVKIVAIDANTDEVFGNYIAKNANANYAVILPPGKWKILFQREGYQDFYLRDIDIEDRAFRNTDIQKHIMLRKK